MDELYSETRLIDVYDVINASREDFDFYLRQLPPPPAVLLDIGCGTGTFACEMALLGYDVTAIDPASAMIAAAQQKDSASLVKWRTGYVSDLPSGPCFDATIMTGHAFQCLLTDQQITDLFQSVARLLKPGGAFHFESRNPAARAWLNWSPENAAPPFDLGNGRTVQVVHEVLEAAQGLVTFEERYHFNDLPEPICSQSTLRFPDLDHITTLAAAVNLTVSSVCGNWRGDDLAPNSPEMIFHLCKQG